MNEIERKNKRHLRLKNNDSNHLIKYKLKNGLQIFLKNNIKIRSNPKKLSFEFGNKPQEFQKGARMLSEQREIPISIRGEEIIAKFEIEGNYLFFQGNNYNYTILLTIEYANSEILHNSRLPINGFNSYSPYHYGEEANNLAIEIMQREGWILENHLSTWPIFSAILTKTPNPWSTLRIE